MLIGELHGHARPYLLLRISRMPDTHAIVFMHIRLVLGRLYTQCSLVS